MDAWFIWVFIWLVVSAIIFFVVPRFYTTSKVKTEVHGYGAQRYEEVVTKSNPRSLIKKLALIPLALAVFFFFQSTYVIVNTNQVGIFTSMGRPYDATDNGWEWKQPWAKKTEFDGARQFLRFCGAGNNEEDLDKKVYPGVSTKIDGNAKADICGVIAWQMKATTEQEKENAISLFKDYRVFERVTTNLVYSNLKVAIGSALAKLNPLIPEQNMTVAQINESVLNQLKKEFDGSVVVQAADISVPDYDPQTDSAIAADLAQKAKTSLEKEKKLTNEAASAANAAIVGSIQDPQVLVNKCLDIAKELGYNPGLCMMSGNGMILDGSALNKLPPAQ